jgi:sugar phosphate isomerase/epimerase
MSQQTQVTLDRDRREALRRDLAGTAHGYGDFEYAFRRGEREYAYKHVKRLRRMIEAMDAIGWTEQPDAPNEQPVPRTRSLIAWARRYANELAGSFAEEEPNDWELDAYGAIRAIGGQV